ncbi:hypothetical protein BJV74DRAFT_796723 [Russula compacta]|nr:hypothetical protein BJV74DRAFT_796723 [Russula compacta]
MSDPIFQISELDGSVTLLFPLDDGTLFPLLSTYSEAQSKAVIALVVVSCVSLVATVGLLCAIAISAFNTRTYKSSKMFVRTHVVFYFVSLLLSDILQAIGSIMNATWVRDQAVGYVSLCTAQGVIKHIADVSIALWSLVIATQTFFVLFLRLEIKRYVMWTLLIAIWSIVGVIVMAGPATANDIHGPYYGISGAWCWIASNYSVQRIVLDYMVMFISALLAFILYSLVFLKLRGIIAYTIMIVPIAFSRFRAWSGHEVPFGLTIFSDFIYLLSGLVHVILFFSTRRILPPRSMFPKFLISNPKLLESTTIGGDGNFDDYYSDAATIRSMSVEAEKGTNYPNEHGITLSAFFDKGDPLDPFADPVLPPIDEAIIKRVDSPDSGRSSADLPLHDLPDMLSPVAVDDFEPSVLPERRNPLNPALVQGEARLQQGPIARMPLKHREGEEIEVPMSPFSVLRYYEDN